MIIFVPSLQYMTFFSTSVTFVYVASLQAVYYMICVLKLTWNIYYYDAVVLVVLNLFPIFSCNVKLNRSILFTSHLLLWYGLFSELAVL